MTREEHIKQEAMRYADNPDIGVLESITAEHSFYDGAVYADQHPKKGLWDSEKVIEWIKNNIFDYYVWIDDDDNVGIDMNEIIKDIKKAMED